MIDPHFHCLPGIDDGPRTWDEAVALCQAAAAEGTETVIATPHVLRDEWINDDPAERDGLLVRLNSMLGGKPSVVAGCEFYFSTDVVQLVERGRWSPLTGLNGSRYLLIEFPAREVPAGAEAIFHELSLLGVTPVVAHPERNATFAREPARLERLVARGAVAQITAGSLLGDFGRSARLACDDLFRAGLVHLIGSDAHSLDRRPPRLAEARAHVRTAWGEAAEKGIFETNPEALLRSDPLPWRGSEPAGGGA
jgi:protein-tyrosine phosphatase